MQILAVEPQGPTGVYLQTASVPSPSPCLRLKKVAAGDGVTRNAPTKVKLHPGDAVLSVNKWPHAASQACHLTFALVAGRQDGEPSG